MPKDIFRSPRAQEDILKAYLHIALDNSAIAEEFMDAIDELLDQLLTHPEMGGRIEFRSPRLQGLRLFRVSEKFAHYLMFYRPTGDGIYVVRVLHSSRDIEALFSE